MSPVEPRKCEARLVVLERNKLLWVASWIMSVCGPLMLLAFFARVFPPGLLGLHIGALGFILRAMQNRHNQRATKREAQVTAAPEGVLVDGVRVVERSAVADGFFQPRAPSRWRKTPWRKYDSSVRLVDKRRRILFEAEAGEEQALEILRVLGLDPGSRRAEFRGSSPLYATARRQIAVGGIALALAFVLGSAFAHAAPAFEPAFFLMLLPLMLAGMVPSKITVGVDGIHTRWLWMKKFIPMSDVRDVVASGDARIVIRFAGGREEVLYTSPVSKNDVRTYKVQHRDAVLARIREALATFRSQGPIADVTGLVGRGTRTRDEWLDALRKLRGGKMDGSYREAAVRSEDLFRVIEDPSAPEDARAGAALVLRDTLDDDGRARIRVAADATASPKLRVALDAAVTTTEGDAEQAVSAVGDDGEQDPRAARSA
jgi:hypothetical protein